MDIPATKPVSFQNKNQSQTQLKSKYSRRVCCICRMIYSFSSQNMKPSNSFSGAKVYSKRSRCYGPKSPSKKMRKMKISTKYIMKRTRWFRFESSGLKLRRILSFDEYGKINELNCDVLRRRYRDSTVYRWNLFALYKYDIKGDTPVMAKENAWLKMVYSNKW